MKEESSHWYTADGTACHSLPTTSKNAQSPTRPVRIADARKMGLFPSVTTILKVLDKPALQNWRSEQVAAAAMRFVRDAFNIADPTKTTDAKQADVNALLHPTEAGDEQIASRIIEAAFLQVEQAADAGVIIHEGCELALSGSSYNEELPVFLPQLNASFPLKVFIRPIIEFVHDNEIEIEANEHRVVNSTVGYAGTIDAPFRSKRGRGILDFKTRKTRAGKPCLPYDEQATQIAAYHVAHYKQPPTAGDIGLNLYISTTEPGRIEAAWYEPQTLSVEWDAFRHICAYWRIRKGYDPRPL